MTASWRAMQSDPTLLHTPISFMKGVKQEQGRLCIGMCTVAQPILLFLLRYLMGSLCCRIRSLPVLYHTVFRYTRKLVSFKPPPRLCLITRLPCHNDARRCPLCLRPRLVVPKVAPLGVPALSNRGYRASQHVPQFTTRNSE